MHGFVVTMMRSLRSTKLSSQHETDEDELHELEDDDEELQLELEDELEEHELTLN